jgi:hypothetical protein
MLFIVAITAAIAGGDALPASLISAANTHRLNPGFGVLTLEGMPSHCQGPPAARAAPFSMLQRSSSFHSMSSGKANLSAVPQAIATPTINGKYRCQSLVAGCSEAIALSTGCANERAIRRPLQD